MGLFTDERQEALESMTVAQLRALAAEYGIDVTPGSADFVTKLVGQNKGKDFIVNKLYLTSDRKLSTKAILAFKQSYKKTPQDEKEAAAETLVPKTSSGQAYLTPTLASQKAAPLVAFEEVVHYLDQYRFISRYSEEAFYEVELAGALREKFGTVIRQNPLPIEGKRLVVDLDVGGVGIEIKQGLADAAQIQRMVGQLASYRAHYGEKLIVLLIGTPGFDEYKNEIRRTGIVLIEK